MHPNVRGLGRAAVVWWAFRGTALAAPVEASAPAGVPTEATEVGPAGSTPIAPRATPLDPPATGADPAGPSVVPSSTRGGEPPGSPPVVPVHPAAKASVTSEDAADGVGDLSLRMCRSLFEQGLSAYTTGDNGAAARWWSMAYDIMASRPELEGPRHVLELDIAQAELRAFSEDQQRARLFAARRHVESYLEWSQDPVRAPTPDEREDRVRALSMLARVGGLEAGVDAPPRPTSLPVAGAEQADALARGKTEFEAKVRSARRLAISGSVLLHGMVIGTGVSIWLGYERSYYALGASDPTIDPYGNPTYDWSSGEYDRLTVALAATLTATAVAGVTGITLVAVGAKRRHRAYRERTLTLRSSGPGLTFSGRF